MSRRTIVYVDGFNFYYGAVRGSPNKWLNLEQFFRRLRPHDEVIRISYFTALIEGPRQRHQAQYLRALETCPLVDILLGKFKERWFECRVRACSHDGDRFFPKMEEKRTDVNIAVTMLVDALHDRCDNFVLVSGDSDLVPALHAIKRDFLDKTVIVYVPSRDPQRGAAVELRAAADKHRDLPLALLPISQFPARIPDGSGGHIERPADW